MHTIGVPYEQRVMIDVVAAEKNGTERPVLGTVSCVSVQEVTESPMYVGTYHKEEPLCES